MGLFSLFAFFAESSAHPRQKAVREAYKQQWAYMYVHGNLNSFFDSQAQWKKKIKKNPSKETGSKLKRPKMHVQHFKG